MIQARGFATRLTIGLALVMVTLSLAALATLDLFTSASDRHLAETRSSFSGLLVAQRLRASVEQAVANSRGHLLSRSDAFLEQMRQSQRAAERLLQQLQDGSRSSESRALVSEIQRAARAYAETAESAISRGRTGTSFAEVAYIFERELRPRRQHLDELLDSLVQLEQRQFQLGSDHIKRERSRTLLLVLGVLSLGFLVSAAVALGLVRHLTTLYRREEAAIDRAERASAAREELLATVAHDLRSPLGAIGLRAASLGRGSGDDQVKRQAAAIEGIVARMEHLVKGLLDAAVIEAGHFTLDRSTVAAPVLIREVVDLFGGTAASHSVRLEQRPSRGHDLLVHADKERIIQVLSNLAVNAIKFTPPQGTVELGVEADAAGVRFCVRDTGPGIPPEQLRCVFERFWKGATPGAKGGAGTGLGLHIAREIVTAHGGRIWAESRPGHGTTFFVWLPTGPPPAPQPTAATDTSLTGLPSPTEVRG
jgi:signal transduction histidine kinase